MTDRAEEDMFKGLAMMVAIALFATMLPIGKRIEAAAQPKSILDLPGKSGERFRF